MQLPNLNGVKNASDNLKDVSIVTPLLLNERLSKKFNSRIFLKREDLQKVRSFKIRGAFNKIKSLDLDNSKDKQIICASAGNHAQGFAYSCKKLKIFGTVYMPETTPKQKVDRVKMFGGDFIKIILIGDNFDDAQKEAQKKINDDTIFIHPFDDNNVIEGQGTIALELLNQIDKHFDYLIIPIGGGGLISGIITVFKELSPKTKIIGVEAKGAPAMFKSIMQNKIIELNKIDNFVDGVSIRKIGNIPFEICKDNLDDLLLVPEGKVCQTILDLYNKDGIVAEPAGAIGISALEMYHEKFTNKNVGVLICGGNNDITRMSEIKERALLYSNLKHYFVVKFPQRSGALKEFVNNVLGENDDITFFEYVKKNNREYTTAIVGIELKLSKDLLYLTKKMKENGFFSEYLNDKPETLRFLI
ncbi:MAG: threonine ammonia-lyase IlvA [Cryomorphaceae bacterium]|jgi:threonine dehydratase|nr:threonine ammonia-lyase IlvA [Cryomorphaceae bacterium]MBT3503656.1 threonine ammonia-lyase IlvA [Cryomorphaceae bacterium]MBT3689266.1 threonine ammonia-lyase IlvA [Cryomorphaceae bacterium]MBT4222096.1 threonine ammonia-lyase IlvA [Cryomorphaceae bacterium]MBT4517176.1 threonine ammonia-lyase IlvA [Cryomorphaceae bacterium]